MENININLKTKKKRIIINGDENKIIEFNPEDMNTRKRFYEASKTIFNSQREFDVKLKALQEDDIDGAFALEEELYIFIKDIIDDIFGEGATDKITDGEINIMVIGEFITMVTPYFKEVNEKQKNKYTNNLKSAGVI